MSGERQEPRGNLVVVPDVPLLGLDGVDLRYIQIDFQTRLQFGDSGIVIGTPFSVRTERGHYALDPERPAELGPLLAIYPSTLASGVIEADLTLRLTFQSGTSLEVPPDPSYESWQVTGPASRLIVCPPGGGNLVVWS